MRALYRVEVVGDNQAAVREWLEKEPRLPPDIREYTLRLLALVASRAEEIDRVLAGALDRWDLKRLAVIDRCVLRIGVAELLYETEVPARVVLDEAIEIAKRFGSLSESGRFVNGVLDSIAREYREEDLN